ncbi:MAG TPA: hypothetical protein VEI50_04700 [Nitrospiraceae bacterium]|nr:hypothetical protein [Nitrospiraceae bacterium]
MKVFRLKKRILGAGVWILVVIGTLLLFEGFLITFNLFPPRYEYGEPDLGWAPLMPGKINQGTCTDESSGQRISILQNELGIRTGVGVDELRSDRESFKIAVVGDSQTALCAPNSQTHPGVLEEVMREQRRKVQVLSYGQGRYSPLQDYLLFKRRLKQFNPPALVMNFYTGNDFYDMLRVDDRPHFVKSEAGYEVHPPIWYRYEDPYKDHTSRILFIVRSLAKFAGVENLSARLRFLLSVATQQNQGLHKVVSYANDLRASLEPEVGYPEAFAAQILNQQIFFHHFPNSREESIQRVRFLLQMIRRENPGMLLIMSPIPSYQLVQQKPIDHTFVRTIARMPFTYEDGLQQEEELYYSLKAMADDLGWLFIDNLTPLRNFNGNERLYNNFDYHLTPAASKVIGMNEAEVLSKYLNSHLDDRGSPLLSRS